MRLKQDYIVAVNWVDQSSYSGPVEMPDVLQPAKGRSVGYYLEENKEWLSIASERFETDRIAYRHIMTFPKVAIKSVEILSKKPKV